MKTTRPTNPGPSKKTGKIEPGDEANEPTLPGADRCSVGHGRLCGCGGPQAGVYDGDRFGDDTILLQPADSALGFGAA